jgi:hypothetical protein
VAVSWIGSGETRESSCGVGLAQARREALRWRGIGSGEEGSSSVERLRRGKAAFPIGWLQPGRGASCSERDWLRQDEETEPQERLQVTVSDPGTERRFRVRGDLPALKYKIEFKTGKVCSHSY